MADILVQKRDGSTEEFHPEKVIRVLLAAGLEEPDALTIASSVAEWVKTQPSPVTTLQIRDRIIELLKPVNTYVAGLYSWYQQTKDRMYTPTS